MRITALRACMVVLGIAMFVQAHATPSASEIAPTPQMGFNNWNSTHCRDEFNETMIRAIVDKFIALGLKDAGYRYINIDD